MLAQHLGSYLTTPVVGPAITARLLQNLQETTRGVLLVSREDGKVDYWFCLHLFTGRFDTNNHSEGARVAGGVDDIPRQQGPGST